MLYSSCKRCCILHIVHVPYPTQSVQLRTRYCTRQVLVDTICLYLVSYPVPGTYRYRYRYKKVLVGSLRTTRQEFFPDAEQSKTTVSSRTCTYRCTVNLYKYRYKGLVGTRISTSTRYVLVPLYRTKKIYLVLLQCTSKRYKY